MTATLCLHHKKMDGRELTTIGWREWVGLPELGLPAVKAKIDTGAKTSALHAFSLETYREKGCIYVRFGIHPLQHREDVAVTCEAEVVDERVVRDSGGHEEMRYVIATPLKIGDTAWPIEITLTDRENMLFRLLLGRSALRTLNVDPDSSYLLGKPSAFNMYKSS